MIRPATNKGRMGFSLVELLVVIAIISILAGLITAAAVYMYKRATDMGNASDINQLATSVTSFKTKFGVYPPSMVMLYPTGQQYANDTTNPNLARESLAILMKIWPNLGKDASGSWSNPGNGTFIDWAGGTVTNWPVVLQGDQCLVFFLGGIPSSSGPGVNGFSASPTNPALLPGQTGGNANVPDRIPPFYNFETSRLVLLHNIPGGVVNPFPSYADRYATVSNGTIPSNNGVPQGQPYAYFTFLKQANQYNPYYSSPYGAKIGAASVSDCDDLGAMPYCSPSVSAKGVAVPVTQYLNPDKFQIISAGADLLFGSITTSGAPTVWNPSAAAGSAMFTPAVNAAMDDRTNFCPNILSAGNAQ